VFQPNKKLPVVNVWKRMTIEELATSAKRDVRDIIEAISLSQPHSFKRYNKTTIIEDQNIIHDAVRKLGTKFKIISQPDKGPEKETKNHDAIKRYE